MGHYCKICGRTRRNEKFSGKGHRDHICKDCNSLPREKKDKILKMDHMMGFFYQSRISEKNLAFLEECLQHSDQEVKELAEMLIKIREVAPHKKRRWKKVNEAYPVIFDWCCEMGIVEIWNYEWDYFEREPPEGDVDIPF